MRTTWRPLPILLSMLLCLPGAVQTGQRPHVHGVAWLTVAIEGGQVAVELAVPAESLIGFERWPRTDAERETLARAVEALESGETLLRFSTDADCRLVSAKVESPLLDPASGHDTGHHHGHSHAHDHGHDHNHADVVTAYAFACARPGALNAVALGLFSAFPALQRVMVEYVTDAGQGAAEVMPARPVVNFVPL